MATHYLIDAHNPTLLSSEINDVRSPADGRTEANGNFVVRVPGDIKLSSDPTNLSDLLTKKYASILAEYPGYSNIVYDDCLDATDFSILGGFAARQAAKLGTRGNIGVASTTLSTSPVALGQVVSQYVLIVEVNRWDFVNSASGRISRYFVEDEAAPLTIDVSTDNGGNYTAAVNGQINQVAAGTEGSTLTMNISGNLTPSDRRFIYINSWAFIY